MSLAFVFPGQGSQRVGMLGKLAESHPEILADFARASQVLHYDLWEIVQENPRDMLNQTAYTQPAILVASHCLWKIFKAEAHPLPAWVAGHSLGEYNALLAAEVLSFEAAVSLVNLRGQLMQAAMPGDQGAMAVILGLAASQVIALCQQHAQGQIVQAANFNTDQQIVISGERPAVERVMVAAKAAGAKRAILLPVSVPAHSECMRTASVKFSEAVETTPMKMPGISFVSNVRLQKVIDISEIRQDLIAQLYSPVNWVAIMEYLQAQGVSEFVECGPGKVLTGLNQRIAKNSSAWALEEKLCHSVEKLP